MKAIRFPLMSHVTCHAELLTAKEIGSMMKYYSGVLTRSLPFVQAPRKKSSNIHGCQRFRVPNPPDIRWCYGKVPDCVSFSVNNPIMLHGVQHFGSEGGNYTVSMEVKDSRYGSSLVKQSGSYASEKDKTCSYYGFSVQLDRPVRLMENKMYRLESLIKGPKAWYGTEGQTSVECQGVVFTFYASPDQGRSKKTIGQFPVLFWSASC